MSSPRSQAVPSFADHAEALRAALIDVAESSFFGFTVPLDETAFTDMVHNPPAFDFDTPARVEPWLVTELRFEGAFAGGIEISMSEALARQMLQAFLGLGPEEVIEESQLFDSTGEFANQVCGTWLTRACQDRRFDLQPPAVVRRPVDWLPLDVHAADEHSGEVLVAVNDLPLRFRARFVPESV